MRLIDADALISEMEKRMKPKIIQIAGGLGYSFYKWFIELIEEQARESEQC